MNTQVNYALIGMFVLTLGAALIAGILWLSVGGPDEDFDTYVIYVNDSVSGLGANAKVFYKGVEVGQVRRKGLSPEDPTQVRIVIGVSPTTPIRTDTVAMIQKRGLTGIAHINLTGDNPDAPPLTAEPDQPYPVIPSRQAFLTRIQGQANELIDSLNTSSQRLNAVLDEDNQAAITRTLSRFDEISQALANRSEKLTRALDDFAEVMHDTRDASGRLPELLERINRAADNVDQTAHDLSSAGKAIEQTARATGDDVGRFTREALPETRRLVRNLNDAAENLRRMSAELARDPSILLYGAPTREPGPGESMRR